jgi:hypothetical protein
VETATKCLATAPASWALGAVDRALRLEQAASSQSRAMRALVRVSSVVKVLDATMNRVVSGSRPRVFSATVGGVDVGDEAALQAVLHVGLERLVDHHGAEVGAADADVDDRGSPCR